MAAKKEYALCHNPKKPTIVVNYYIFKKVLSKTIHTFQIPKNVTSDISGYEFLSEMNLTTYRLADSTILIDFFSNDWFDPNLCSPLGAIVQYLRTNNNKVLIYGLQELTEKVFRKNGFMRLCNKDFEPEISYTPKIDFKNFKLDDNINFQQYVDEQLLNYSDLPSMSNLLKKKINKSILEIFNNAHIHGKCEYVYTCGEYFEKNKLLKFTISDLGQTIRKNVNEYFESGSKIDGKNSIIWAVEEGHTTKKGPIPGGLGISLIRDFLKLNGGTLQIISSNGYWEEKNGTIFVEDLKNRFLGTIVNLEFNLEDTKTYYLSSEINPENVL